MRPGTPERGARPSGLENGPGACGATPHPERAGADRATAAPRKVPPENPGSRAGEGDAEKQEPAAAAAAAKRFQILAGRDRRRRPGGRGRGFRARIPASAPPPRPARGAVTTATGPAPAATAHRVGGGTSALSLFPAPASPGVRATPLPWRHIFFCLFVFLFPPILPGPATSRLSFLQPGGSWEGPRPRLAG